MFSVKLDPKNFLTRTHCRDLSGFVQLQPHVSSSAAAQSRRTEQHSPAAAKRQLISGTKPPNRAAKNHNPAAAKRQLISGQKPPNRAAKNHSPAAAKRQLISGKKPPNRAAKNHSPAAAKMTADHSRHEACIRSDFSCGWSSRMAPAKLRRKTTMVRVAPMYTSWSLPARRLCSA